MKVRLTETDLQNIITESVKNILQENNEEEGLWGGLKGVGKWAANGVANSAKNAMNKGSQMAQNAANSFRNTMNKGSQMAQNAMEKGQKMAQDVKQGAAQTMANAKQSYEKGSTKQTHQKIANQLEKWIASGVFDNPRSKSLASQLVKMLNASYAKKFGEDGEVQNNFRQ